MLKLHHFGPVWDLVDASPFCAKVIYYLKLTGIPFESVTGVGQLRRAPKGKLPYIEDGTERIADSEFIVDYLEQRYRPALAVEATAVERAAAHALCRMIEEHLYWVGVYIRWVMPENWQQLTRPAFFGGLPWPVSTIVPRLVRTKISNALHSQGLGRHSHEEIMAIGERDMRAAADFLAGRPFVLGAAPSRPDTTVYAFLESLAVAPHESALKNYVAADPHLRGYLDRMRARLAAAEAGSAPAG